MKRVIAGLLLAGAFSVCFCAVSPSFANYKYDELVKSQRRQKRNESWRDEALEKRDAQRAKEKERAAEYERRRQKELLRKIEAEKKKNRK